MDVDGGDFVLFLLQVTMVVEILIMRVTVLGTYQRAKIGAECKYLNTLLPKIRRLFHL